MHIGLIMQGGRSWLGGVDYIKNLILALGNLSPDERAGFRMTLLSDGPIDAELEHALRPHLDQILDIPSSLPPETLANRIQWFARRQLQGRHNVRFSQFCREAGIEFIYPYQAYHGSVAQVVGVRAAAWIPDFQHKYLAHFFTKEELSQRESYFENTISVASHVVLSSESAAADFRRYYPEQIHKAKILRFTVWPDVNWLQGNPSAVQAAYNLPDRFFLICNQFWQHKNHLLVLDALHQLKKKGIRPEIVCTGYIHDYRNPSFTDELLQTIHRFDLDSQVRLLGVVPREEQIQLIRRCLAVIQPSLFEGWSTIVEFAKTLGRPIVLSDLAVHYEQCADASFFRRDSGSELATLLAYAWNNLESGPDAVKERESMMAGEDRARKFAREFLSIAR